MPASLPRRFANGVQQVPTERHQIDGLSPVQRQANARPATEQRQGEGVYMDQYTGGAFRALRLQRLSAQVRSYFVRLCVPQGRFG
jgi:hypothetical protein